MTRQRKLDLALSLVLLAVLALVCLLPLAPQKANAAPPVVPDFDSWESAYSGNYYDNLNTDLTGKAFRTELAELITSTHRTNTVYNGNSSLALNNVWPKSDVADPKNPNNGQMKWFYTGTVTSSSNFGGNVGQTNREHVWAKNSGKTFTAESGPGADAHHLRPTECQLNSGRGNLGFDEVTQSSSNIVKQDGRTDYGTFPDGLCFKAGSFFYPAKGYRGATARILFYMQVRYGDQFNLEFVDGPTTNDGKAIGRISTLMKWHIEEPPNEDEIYRNNVIAGIQGNRNPFIDHPEYAEMIYCNNGANYSNKLQQVVATYGSYLNGNDRVEVESLTLTPSQLDLTVGDSATVTVTAQPVGASNAVNWSVDNSGVVSVSNGRISALKPGEATVTAASIFNSSVKASVKVTVKAVELQRLVISPTSVNLTVGNSRQLSVTAYPSGADPSVRWESSDVGVATVGATGLVTATGQGETTITARSTVNSGVYATVTVKVLSQADNTQVFLDAMGALDTATTLRERYSALNSAIEAYNNMDASSQQSVTQQHQALLAKITQYNDDIATYNREFASATDFSSQVVALSLSAVLLAIAAIVFKRLGR